MSSASVETRGVSALGDSVGVKENFVSDTRWNMYIDTRPRRQNVDCPEAKIDSHELSSKGKVHSHQCFHSEPE